VNYVEDWLFEAALDQLREDLANNDHTAIEQLFSQVPTAALEGFIDEAVLATVDK
jgi:hypothetical protein